jgi:hypothetical protein
MERWQSLPQSFRFGTIVFIITRLIYSVWAIIILSIQPASAKAPQPIIRNFVEQWLLAPWYRWDAVWFLKIAREGYLIVDGRSAYYPLYPALTRVVGDLLGHNYMLSGLIVSNLATWAALILLYTVTRHHFSETVARRAVVALALYPFYIFNLVYYADSLLLLLSLATFWALQTKRWGWVGIFASLAVLSKLPGVILLAPITWEFLEQRRRLFGKDVLAVLAIPLTIVLWTIILRFMSDEVIITDFSSPFSILTPVLTPSFQQQFDVSLAWPWEGLILGVQAIWALWGKVLWLKVILDMFIVIVFTVAIPFILRLPRVSYFVYSLGLYLMNLTLVMPSFPLADFPRRMMVAFPVFAVFALAMGKGWGNRLIVVLGVFLSAIVSAFLLWWVWMG